jgi:hypothetical protein
MRPNPGTIIATLALFVALTGSAYAALKVSGKQIRNGTISGLDVRDGTIRGRDLDRKARVGVPGPAGPRGPQGERGPSDAFATEISEARVGNDNVAALATDLSLPPGRWVLSVSGVLANAMDTVENGRCLIVQEALDPDESFGLVQTGRVLLAPGGGSNGSGRQPFSLDTAVELPAATDVSVRCSTRDETAVVRVQDVSMTAISVENLTDQRLPGAEE